MKVLLLKKNPSFRISVSDEDHGDSSELTFSASIGSEDVSATFTLDEEPNPANYGTMVLDLSNLQNAGLYRAELKNFRWY